MKARHQLSFFPKRTAMSDGSEKQLKGSDLVAIQVSLSALSYRVLSSELKQTECMYY